MASLKYEANATFQSGTLTSSYTSGGGTLSLTSGHGDRFPSAGDFWVRIDSEIFKVTARTGDTLTVTGAQDGTSAANHSAGAAVKWVMGAAALDQMRSSMLGYGTYANLPATTEAKTGDRYRTSDSIYEFIYNGSAWIPFYGPYKCTLPLTTGWSWVNQETATIDTSKGYFDLYAPATSGRDMRLYVRTAPGTPYTITALVIFNRYPLSPTNIGGLVYRQASLEDFHLIGNYNDLTWASAKWTDANTPSADYIATNGVHHRGPLWIRISDNGVNRISSFSTDGDNFVQFHSIGRTDFITADQVGIALEGYNNRDAYLRLISWVAS